MRIHLGGLVLDGTETPDAAYTIESDGVSGVFGGVGVHGENILRPHAHGAFSMERWRDPRVIEVEGLVQGRSSFELHNRKFALSGVGANGGEIGLVAEFDGMSLSCAVRLESAPLFQELLYGRLARYRVAFRADDPRLYGREREFSGSSVQVHHFGNFAAWPVIEVRGPRTGPYTVTGPGGRVVRVTQSLSSGQTHRIDFASGGVTRNGVRQLGVVSHWEPWGVEPGMRLPVSISAGSMTVYVTDTYM